MTFELSVQDWRFELLRAVLLGLFGLAVLLWPSLSLQIFVVLFGAFLIAEGAFVTAATLREWPGLIRGLLLLALGVMVVAWPGVTGLVLLYVIAAWALLSGIGEIALAIRLRSTGGGDGLLWVLGGLSLVIGVVLLARPVSGVVAIAWLIGCYAILMAILTGIRAMRVRR